jgi:hypothetical protein
MAGVSPLEPYECVLARSKGDDWVAAPAWEAHHLQVSVVGLLVYRKGVAVRGQDGDSRRPLERTGASADVRERDAADHFLCRTLHRCLGVPDGCWSAGWR